MMNKLLTTLVLSGLVVACGGDDDGGSKPSTDAGLDSSVHDASVTNDSGATTTAKVEHPGAACTVATAATACGGSAPVCATTTWAVVAYPGNHCEATCTSAADCGPTGTCPIGQAIASPIYGSAVSNALQTKTGVCYQKCTVGSGTNDGCRDGYVCKTIAQSFNNAAAQQIPEFGNGTACLPENGLAIVPDAGVRDAGAALAVDGGLDAGR